jgi:hypothetical protein
MGWGAPKKTWNGQGVLVKQGTLAELRAALPEFMLQPFGAFPNINEDLQQVVRKPTTEDQRTIPVGVVSLSYDLVQHTEVLDWLRAGTAKAGLADDLIETDLYLSHYGERMLLWAKLKNQIFDPGDGFPLRSVIVCQNSVDKSCSMEIFIMQVREVCSNAMMRGYAHSIRRKHIRHANDRMNFTNELSAALKWASRDFRVLSEWYQTSAAEELINDWVDAVLAKKWTVSEAARIAAICRMGWDGDVKPDKRLQPSQLQVGCMDQVPGACAPVNNVYHAAQALSWIASRQPAMEIRLAKTKQIPELIEALIKIL